MPPLLPTHQEHDTFPLFVHVECIEVCDLRQVRYQMIEQFQIETAANCINSLGRRILTTLYFFKAIDRDVIA